jgi:hypothetical protein
MPLFSRQSLLLQTTFSELKRRASEQSVLFVGTPGSVGERTVSGRSFWYRQFYDPQGTKSAEYLGAVGNAEAERLAQDTRERIEITNALIAEARELSRQGYARVDSRTGAILSALANHGIFRAGALLVGSHAYGALLNELGIRAANYFTEDVDIARARPLKVVLPQNGGFAQMLADSTIDLHPVPGLDRKSPPTSYKTKGADRLRVDLLVPIGGDEVKTRPVPELNAHAMALPFLAYLLERPIEGVLLGREGAVPVKLPRPEAFAWHKMLVSELRGSTREKQGKDRQQASVIFAALAEDAPDALAQAFEQIPRGGKSKARRAAKIVLELLNKANHERAANVLAGFL